MSAALAEFTYPYRHLPFCKWAGLMMIPRSVYCLSIFRNIGMCPKGKERFCTQGYYRIISMTLKMCIRDRLGEALSSSWYYPGDFEEPPESGHECFSAMRVIYNPRDIRQPLAVLRVDTQAQRLRQLISQPESTENGIFLLLREKAMCISDSSCVSHSMETQRAVWDGRVSPSS